MHACFDNGATTVMDPRVLDAMLPYFSNMYGNPHSRSHAYGWEADDACEHAREQVANLIGANSKEIIFTSGVTESNNLALKGVTNYAKTKTGKKGVITTQIEHKCLIDLQQLEDAIRPGETVLVSKPLKKIGEIRRKHGVYFHTDCAQAVGKIPLDVNDMNIDLMSIFGHKVYGPKGVGALYVEMDRDKEHVSRLTRKLLDGIRGHLPKISLNGSESESASLEPSYVLRAIGVGDDLAHTSLRFGIGRFTPDEEADNAIAKVIEQVRLIFRVRQFL
ncbi:cysteine desulfurylase, putative [Perkinsus marinus ATCC 50983]|uniref:Cysteine desulfurylase, putative n=1 Tax=Perkinsus marinus (strain ATCC 50983 / TXsc) TaxID=423536 RepID=C5L8G4_PERM5|nr:cysteine desulfurylase, putative [Perkinsus marinus ATCC 50983]EER06984.1 cysteine desulfurylase, putative [Perkinsus marinus ATCC 50983]|eukprot:XP_002775168.1 cysteine desulfurylase, putative [Perkinsus marinus ATCC 50983]